MRIEGARVLLTGASGGIGNAIARALHSRGAELAISGRREDALRTLRDELGDRVEILVADLAEPAAARELAGRAGRVDVLVANAALPGSGRLDTFSEAEIDRALEVNLRAPIHLSHALLPAMRERGSGHLVFVNSLSGKVAAGGASIYSATKFGLRGFGAALRDELHGTGVGVTSVFPGFISDAGMWADTGLDLKPGMSTRSPQQVADAVVGGIERDRGEVDVAPVTLRAGAWAWGLAPSPMAGLARRLGGAELADQMGEAQRPKR